MIKFREGLNDQIKNKGDKKKIEREKDQAYYKYAIQNSK